MLTYLAKVVIVPYRNISTQKIVYDIDFRFKNVPDNMSGLSVVFFVSRMCGLDTVLAYRCHFVTIICYRSKRMTSYSRHTITYMALWVKIMLVSSDSHHSRCVANTALVTYGKIYETIASGIHGGSNIYPVVKKCCVHKMTLLLSTAEDANIIRHNCGESMLGLGNCKSFRLHTSQSI